MVVLRADEEATADGVTPLTHDAGRTAGIRRWRRRWWSWTRKCRRSLMTESRRLHDAVSTTGQVEAVNAPVAPGADMQANGRRRSDASARRGAYQGHVVAMKVLAALGADRQAKAADGAKPLHDTGRTTEHVEAGRMPVARLERGLPRDTTVTNPSFQNTFRFGCAWHWPVDNNLYRGESVRHTPSTVTPRRPRISLRGSPHPTVFSLPPHPVAGCARCVTTGLRHHHVTRFVRGCVAVIRVWQPRPCSYHLFGPTHGGAAVCVCVCVCVDTCIGRRVGASSVVVGGGEGPISHRILADIS